MAKGGSKVITAIISFLLGFIFAFVVEIGAIVGIVYYALNSSLDKVFGTFGFGNSDSEGRQYINTDTENGGVYNALELISKLQSMMGGIGNVTLADFEELFPAAGGLTESIYNMLETYVALDRTELASTAFMDLPTFISNAVMEIRPASVITAMGGVSLDGNVVMNAILAGVEASYVYENAEDKENSAKYPVYYDEYTYNAELEKYYRSVSVDGVDAYPDSLSADEWLTYSGRRDNDGNNVYRQYYYVWDNGGETCYIATKKDDSGDFIFSADLSSAPLYYAAYGDDGVENKRLTGNYYFDNDGTEVQVNPVTLRTLIEDAFAPLDSVPATDVLGDDEIVVELFGDMSLGDVLNGNIDLSGLIDGLEISTILDIDPDDAILSYLGYGLTSVRPSEGEDYTYTGKYKTDEGETLTCYIAVDEAGYISSVYYYEGESKVFLAGTLVKDISERISSLTDNLYVSDIIDINPSTFDEEGNTVSNNAIMLYIAFSVTDLKPTDEPLVYTGVYHTYITETFEDEEGNEITVRRAVAYDCLVYTALTENGGEYVTGVFGTDGEEFAQTTIGGIADQTSGVADALTLGDLLTIDSSNKVLYAIRNSTLNGIPDAISNLAIQQIYTDEIYKNGVDEDGNAIYIGIYEATEENFSPDYLYYVLVGDEYVFVNNDATDGTRGKLETLPDDGVTYYTYGKASGTWRFMLYDNDDSEQIYSVNDIGTIMSNVTVNIKAATVAELRDAGIVTEEIGDSYVPYLIVETDDMDGNGNPYVIYYVMNAEECTVNQLLNSISILTTSRYAQALITYNTYQAAEEPGYPEGYVGDKLVISSPVGDTEADDASGEGGN